jgi:uncharacterized protein YbjT (DUF2867 family)
MKNSQTVLIVGTTGYVGGRLVPRMLEEGYQVRVLTRELREIEGRRWVDQVQVVHGDILKDDIFQQAFEGVEVAYYLIPQKVGLDIKERSDLLIARKFSQAAKEHGLKRIIDFSSYGNHHSHSSTDPKWQPVGDVVRESGIPITEFRSAAIIGCGSTAFEMVRYLTERLPITLLPQWSYNKIQPIATSDVMDYLIAALENPLSDGKIIEIGGPDILSMSDMMRIYAEVRGLRRWMIPVPALPPRISAYWIHWITPVPARIAYPLIENIRHDVTIHDDLAQQLFPEIQPMSFRESVEFSLRRLDAGQVETSWRDRLSTAIQNGEPVVLTSQEGMIYEQRRRMVSATPEKVFQIVSRLGGDEGWLYLDWAWKLRGIMDRILGGVGLQRGRRDPQDLRVGDAVDFWRVETIEPNRLLRFRAEMALPGLAWLQFETSPIMDDNSLLQLTAIFAPKGFIGWIYWYFYYPFHKLIFPGLVREIAKRAEGKS